MNSDNRQSVSKLLFTLKEVSERLGGMPVSTLRRFIHKGWLERVRHVSRPWYFTEEQIQNFIRRLNSVDDDDE